MRIELKEGYRGRPTKNEYLSAGIHEVDDSVGEWIIMLHPELCRRANGDAEITGHIGEIEPERAAPPKEEVKDTARELAGFLSESDDDGDNEPALRPSPADKFWCCGKNYKNQGSLNLHQKGRKHKSNK